MPTRKSLACGAKGRALVLCRSAIRRCVPDLNLPFSLSPLAPQAALPLNSVPSFRFQPWFSKPSFDLSPRALSSDPPSLSTPNPTMRSPIVPYYASLLPFTPYQESQNWRGTSEPPPFHNFSPSSFLNLDTLPCFECVLLFSKCDLISKTFCDVHPLILLAHYCQGFAVPFQGND